MGKFNTCCGVQHLNFDNNELLGDGACYTAHNGSLLNNQSVQRAICKVCFLLQILSGELLLQFSVELLLEFFYQGWVDERVRIFTEKCQMHAVEGFVTIEVNVHIDGYWAVHTGHASVSL